MQKFLAIVIMLLCIQNFVKSQNLNISGYITDNQFNSIESASVRLCRLDSTVISSGTSASDGFFHLKVSNEKPSLQTLLYVTHLSFERQIIPVSLSHDTVINVYLLDKSYQIGAIDVIEEKKAIELQDGNMVINVSQISNAETYDAAKLLSRLPGVTVSKKEGLTLNGMSATLYIDGRKQMFSMDKVIAFLKALPASSIEQIELNSMLLGKYDASTGAVVNIKMRKQRSDGYYLSIGGSGLLDENNKMAGGANYFLMFKKNNVTLNTNFSYENDYEQNNTLDNTFYQNGSSIIIDKLYKIRTDVYTGSANLSWDIKNGNLLNFSTYIYDDFGIHRNAEPTTIHNSIGDRDYTQYSKNRSNDDLWSGNIEYSSKDSLSYQITTSYGFVYGGLRSRNEYFSKSDLTTDREWFMDSNGKMIGHEHTVKIDYTQKFGKKIILDIGAKADIGKLNDDVIYTIESSYPGTYPTSHFTGKENIYGCYADLNYKINNKLSVKSSVRAEHTDYDINLKTENEHTSRNYWNTFPYLAFLLKTNKYESGFGFTSRISRPDYEWMLPGIRYINDYSYSVGNPYLEPQKSYSFVWNNLFFGFAFFALRYTYTVDESGLILMEQNGNMTEYTYFNFSDKRRTYAQLSLPFEFFNKKFNGRIDTSVDYSKYYNSKNGYVIPKDRNGFWRGEISGSLQYQITDRFGINSWTIYEPEYKTLQYDFQPRWSMDFGLSYSVLKNDRLTFALDAENVFDTHNRKYIYYYDSTIKRQNSRSNDRFIKFSLRIKFNGGEKIDEDEAKSNLNDISRFSKD